MRQDPQAQLAPYVASMDEVYVYLQHIVDTTFTSYYVVKRVDLGSTIMNKEGILKLFSDWKDHFLKYLLRGLDEKSSSVIYQPDTADKFEADESECDESEDSDTSRESEDPPLVKRIKVKEPLKPLSEYYICDDRDSGFVYRTTHIDILREQREIDVPLFHMLLSKVMSKYGNDSHFDLVRETRKAKQKSTCWDKGHKLFVHSTANRFSLFIYVNMTLPIVVYMDCLIDGSVGDGSIVFKNIMSSGGLEKKNFASLLLFPIEVRPISFTYCFNSAMTLLP